MVDHKTTKTVVEILDDIDGLLKEVRQVLQEKEKGRGTTNE